MFLDALLALLLLEDLGLLHFPLPLRLAGLIAGVLLLLQFLVEEFAHKELLHAGEGALGNPVHAQGRGHGEGDIHGEQGHEHHHAVGAGGGGVRLGLVLHGDFGEKPLAPARQNGDENQSDGGPGEGEVLHHVPGRRRHVQAEGGVVHVDPPGHGGPHLGKLRGDGPHQVDLPVGHELGDSVPDHGGAVLHLGDALQAEPGAADGVHHLLDHVLAQHHEVGDGLADDGVQGQQDGQGQKAPQAPGHGADALLGVELLHLLRLLGLVVGVFLLDFLETAGHAAHAHHALLGLHLEGQHDELDDQGEENDGHAVGIGQVVEQPDQPGEGDTDKVSDG